MPTHEYASKLYVPSWFGQDEESANGVGAGSRGHWLSCNVHRMYTEVVPVISTVTHRGWRGARLARRDEGAHWGMCDRGATPSRRDASPAECYRNDDRGHLASHRQTG